MPQTRGENPSPPPRKKNNGKKKKPENPKIFPPKNSPNFANLKKIPWGFPPNAPHRPPNKKSGNSKQ